MADYIISSGVSSGIILKRSSMGVYDGGTADKITLRFGYDGSVQFATLSGMGAFFDATSERIFEENGKGILASL